MKTMTEPNVAADSVIAEVRRAKTAVGQKYGFDVRAMVRGLRELDRQGMPVDSGSGPAKPSEAKKPGQKQP